MLKLIGVFLGLYLSGVSAIPTAVSPALAPRAPPVDNLCNKRDVWLARECYPDAGLTAWVDICSSYYSRPNPFEYKRGARCPPNTYCENIEEDGEDTIKCVDGQPPGTSAATKSAKDPQIGSSANFKAPADLGNSQFDFNVRIINSIKASVAAIVISRFLLEMITLFWCWNNVQARIGVLSWHPIGFLSARLEAKKSQFAKEIGPMYQGPRSAFPQECSNSRKGTTLISHGGWRICRSVRWHILSGRHSKAHGCKDSVTRVIFICLSLISALHSFLLSCFPYCTRSLFIPFIVQPLHLVASYNHNCCVEYHKCLLLDYSFNCLLMLVTKIVVKIHGSIPTKEGVRNLIPKGRAAYPWKVVHNLCWNSFGSLAESTPYLVIILLVLVYAVTNAVSYFRSYSHSFVTIHHHERRPSNCTKLCVSPVGLLKIYRNSMSRGPRSFATIFFPSLLFVPENPLIAEAVVEVTPVFGHARFWSKPLGLAHAAIGIQCCWRLGFGGQIHG
jgi:hypothetical protein